MINITFADKTQRQFEPPVDGYTVAAGISEGFARNCVAMEANGRLMDIYSHLQEDASIRFITPKDPEALDILRHTAAHIMAQAVLRLYPDAQPTIGPVVEDGFYYDFDMEPISEEDFPKIEAEM
jgi:threonyl-tRNA synthetase